MEGNKDSNELDESKKERLLRMSEISLLLDNYDDIFSDFDPRHYSQRAISDDLLSETRRASRDKASGIIELKFMVPENKRNSAHESVIKKRLREHFRRHYTRLQEEVKEMVKQGVIFTAFGIILMLIASFVMFNFKSSFYSNFFIILLEPGSWFLFWEGLRQIVFEPKNKKSELDFYRKMAKCEITFSAF
jgi:hypothetical protein